MSEVEGSYRAEGNNKSFQVIPPSPAGESPRPATTPVANEPVVRKGGVVTRYDAATGQMTVTSREQRETQPIKPPTAVASARNQLGQPIDLSAAGPKDVISIPGAGDGRADALVLAGVLRKLPTGGYEVVAGSVPDAEKPPADAADDSEISMEGVTGTTAGADLVHGQLKAAAGEQVYSGLVQGLITGHDTTAQIEEVARRSGQSVEHVREAVTGVYTEFENAAKSIAKVNGVEPHAWDDFVMWASDNQPDAALDAFNNLVSKHEAAGVARLAKQYARTDRGATAYSDADLLGATYGDGVTAVQTPKGVQLEIRGHGRMTFKMAVARGLVRWSK